MGIKKCQRANCSHFSWARKHLHLIVDAWKHIAWCDEFHFQLHRSDGCVLVWRQPHESVKRTCQQGTFQAAGDSVMVWGVCSWRDMGPLIRLVTGDGYVSILSNHLHPFLSILNSGGLGQFQLVNATPHISRVCYRVTPEALF